MKKGFCIWNSVLLSSFLLLIASWNLEAQIRPQLEFGPNLGQYWTKLDDKFSVDTYPGIAGKVGFDIRYYLGKDQLATGLKLNFINSRYTERFDAFYAGELFVLFQVPMIYTRQVFERWSVGGGISHNILMATDRRLAHWNTERQYYLGSHVELNFHISERWAVSLQHEYIGWFKVRTYREYVYGNYNLLFRYQL